MRHRTALKWLHWLSSGLLLYFFLVEPDDSQADPGGALGTHAGMGVLLALVVGTWMVLYMRKGLAGRPGPKLPVWAKRFHSLSHRVLQWGVVVVVATGALAGLAAPFAIRALGVLPINPAAGGKSLHDTATEIHEIAFDALIIVILAHIGFHLWRHFRLKDNALRIMVPRIVHRYL